MRHAGPPSGMPDTVQPLAPAEFERWYGGWAALTPDSIANFLKGFDHPWWIVGGWALQKATGVQRRHEDMDISTAHHDAPALRDFLLEKGFTTWNQDDGWFRPYDGRFGDIREDSGIWVRADAQSPWILDIPLTPFKGQLWSNKRLPTQTYPLSEVTWVSDDGLRYLNPEIVLFMKAAQTREKDILDAATTLEKLTSNQRDWLRETIRTWNPSHQWASL